MLSVVIFFPNGIIYHLRDLVSCVLKKPDSLYFKRIITMTYIWLQRQILQKVGPETEVKRDSWELTPVKEQLILDSKLEGILVQCRKSSQKVRVCAYLKEDVRKWVALRVPVLEEQGHEHLGLRTGGYGQPLTPDSCAQQLTIRSFNSGHVVIQLWDREQVNLSGSFYQG